MKKKYLLPLFLLGLLVGCTPSNNHNFDDYENQKIEISKHTGTLGSFNLLSPANGSDVVKDIPTFEWESSINADSYTLELCSDPLFIDDEDVIYIKKTNICDTKFTLDSYLRTKEIPYYWRVTANNKDESKQCNGDYRSFFLKSPDYGEISFDIEYAEEWEVHKEGSQCQVSIDKNDFFNTGVKNSLLIAFDETQTNIGNPSSDGWMVVTHNQETELYGVDAFYFNFYYNGQDSNIFIRVVDEDNEYWNAEIKVATNAQQTIILKFDEFTLRTKGGTPIANKVFDYNYIKSVELVFEQSFGDGICIINDLKAIKYDDYKHLFLSEVNFNDYSKDTYIYDNYNKFETSITNDGKDFTVGWGGDFKGYGFVKIPVERLLVTGDSLTMKFGYTGDKGCTILFRIIEEDGDRWLFRQKCNAILDNEITIPFNAFTLSEANGDGARQFYYIKQLQFGIENSWSTGSMTFSNLHITTLSEKVEDLYLNEVASDGTIETFDKYTSNCDLYYRWQNTVDNKDEAMALDSQYTATGNGYCGKFTYKSDMYPACYGIQFKDGIEGFNAVKFDCLDKSVLKNLNTTGEGTFAHLGTGAAKMLVTLYTKDGATYTHVINSLNQEWTTYEIPFTAFELDEGFSPYTSLPLTSENLIAFRIGLQFYYYNKDGKSNPQYTSNNPIYLDNIKLCNATEYKETEVVSKVKPSTQDPSIAIFDDFENITNETVNNYFGMADYDYSKLAIVDGYNNSKALELQYKGNATSVSYVKMLSVDASVTGKALQFDMKGDGKATVYVNLFFDYAGNTYKFRATINNVSDQWETYTIGFDIANFKLIEGTGSFTISSKSMQYLSKMTIGIVNYKDNNLSTICIDNVKLVTNGVSYSTYTHTVIGG